MTKAKKYALTSLITFGLSLVLFLYAALSLGLFSSDTIIVSTLATTGPDYEVQYGQFKLARLMPDSVQSYDVSGIMVTEESEQKITHFLNDWDDYSNYYVFTFTMVGVQKSDSFAYHPLLEINSCKQINFLVFWSLLILEFGLLVLFRVFYRKYKRHSLTQTLTPRQKLGGQ